MFFWRRKVFLCFKKNFFDLFDSNTIIVYFWWQKVLYTFSKKNWIDFFNNKKTNYNYPVLKKNNYSIVKKKI